MAVTTVTATFTGAEDSITVTWTGIGALQSIGISAAPSDGFGPIQPWLTQRSMAGAIINVSARWQGKVTLTITDSANGQNWGPPYKPIRLTGPLPNGTSTSGGSAAVYAVSIYMPSDTQGYSATLYLANRLWNGGRGNDVTSNVAVYQSDGTGLPTGTALAVFNGSTIKGDGTNPAIGSFTVNRGSDGKVVVLYSLPATTNCSTVGSTFWGSYVLNTTTVSPAPTGWTANPTPVFWLQLQCVTQKRRMVIFGNSILEGSSTGTACGFENTAWQLIAADKDMAVAAWGLPGGTLAEFADPITNSFLIADVIWNGDEEWWNELGVNDLNTGASTMETNLTTINTYVKGKTTGRRRANTIMPQASYAGTETARNTFNSDLKGTFGTTTLGLFAVSDLAATQANGGLTSNIDGTKLYGNGTGETPTYSADGTHITPAGNVQAKTKNEAVL